MKKLPIALILAVILLATSGRSVSAKRLLPFLSSPVVNSRSVTSTASSRGVPVSVHFRSDRRAIIVTFSNVTNFASISYSLSYSARGIPQGVMGTISNSDPNQTKEILFGTCSNGVCRYDTNITSARFTVITTLNSGLKIRKTFVLRV